MKNNNNIFWVTESMIEAVEIDNNVCNAAVQTDNVIDFISAVFNSKNVRFETDGARDAAEELLMDAYAKTVNAMAASDL